MRLWEKWMIAVALAGLIAGLGAQELVRSVMVHGQALPLYPQVTKQPSGLPSPCRTDDGRELVTARTRDGEWALVDVTVPDWNKEEVKYFGENVLRADSADFPTLARSGLHAMEELGMCRAISGRPLAEINELARPGRLSTAGFLAEDEDVLSVLRGDDRLARKLGFTHPQLARPLLHMWNVILQEQKHGRGVWGRGHAWKHVDHFLYNGRRITYEAHFTKGGQLSPFGDGIEGAVHVFLRRDLDPVEAEFLAQRYGALGPERLEALQRSLSALTTGELQPFYIVRYGFYEGHTAWRVDPLAIASIFGLRSLEELEKTFPGKLEETLRTHFTAAD
ncbi:MAG: hypothetical protein JXO51_06925 [Candidatus Aminicenantes bacterium]|nr:hypothetical protein [Candidatus Aminicenantes bacterium]